MTDYKNWSGISMAPQRVDARHRDGRQASQVRLAVRASSKAAARSALAIHDLDPGRSYFDNHWSDSRNGETLAALDEVDVGTVLVAPLDPGGTIMGGSTGWARLLPRGFRNEVG